MEHFAGLDVSVKETSVCILDDAGKIVKEVKVPSEPQALLKVLGNPIYRLKRIGLEADMAWCDRHVANGLDLDMAIDRARLEFECRNFELTRTIALLTLRSVR